MPRGTATGTVVVVEHASPFAADRTLPVYCSPAALARMVHTLVRDPEDHGALEQLAAVGAALDDGVTAGRLDPRHVSLLRALVAAYGAADVPDVAAIRQNLTALVAVLAPGPAASPRPRLKLRTAGAVAAVLAAVLASAVWVPRVRDAEREAGDLRARVAALANEKAVEQDAKEAAEQAAAMYSVAADDAIRVGLRFRECASYTRAWRSVLAAPSEPGVYDQSEIVALEESMHGSCNEAEAGLTALLTSLE